MQLRLPGFSLESLRDVGARVRDLCAAGSPASARVSALVDDRYVADLAAAVAGSFGGRVGVASVLQGPAVSQRLLPP